MRFTILFFLKFSRVSFSIFFFFNDTATTEIYTLSLHDALPISVRRIDANRLISAEAASSCSPKLVTEIQKSTLSHKLGRDRKSTRLNSSHLGISYAVFCLKKKIFFYELCTMQHQSSILASPTFF